MVTHILRRCQHQRWHQRWHISVGWASALVGRTIVWQPAEAPSARRVLVAVQVELIEQRNALIEWAEPYEPRSGDTLGLLDEIGNQIVSSIAAEIETAERNRAILKPPSPLDTWEAHYRGLWHICRFPRGDSEQARQVFELAVRSAHRRQIAVAEARNSDASPRVLDRQGVAARPPSPRRQVGL